MIHHGAERSSGLLLAAGLVLACGGSGGGGSGSGGSAPVIEISSADSRCAPLPGSFPPGLDLVPGVSGRAVVASFTPPSLLPFDLGPLPPVVAAAGSVPAIPPDSDGDGCAEGSFFPCPATSPVLDGVLAVSAGLALVTASSYEEVIFVNPADGRLVPGVVGTPAGFVPGQYIYLPPPGTAAVRTAVSTSGCVAVAPGTLDSRGDVVVPPPASWCLPGAPSFRPTFTSGAAVAGGHLFVSMSNLNDNTVPASAQYLPGTLLVYDFDLSSGAPAVTPNAATPVILTSGFNPTHVTAYRTPLGRDLVLVSVSGAIGRRTDDPATPTALEAGGLALTGAAIDVVDAVSLRLLATVPLGAVGLAYDRLAIDPMGRVALAGSAITRALYGIDLAPLDALPAAPPVPLVLDGTTGPDARIFYAGFPFTIPARADAPPAATCDGFVVSADWNAAGSRLYASEYCDGTLSTIEADLSGNPSLAELRGGRFRFSALDAVFAPLAASAVGKPRAPGSLRVRSGRPGIDYTGADVFVLVGLPEGLLCGIRFESR